MARGGDFGVCGVEAMIVSRDVKSSKRGEDVFSTAGALVVVTV